MALNAASLLGSKVISQIINFFYIMLTARYLGAESFGLLSFALAFTGIFGIVSDLGVKKVLVRDLARDASLMREYLGKILVIKITLIAFSFFLIVIFINILNYPELTRRVVYILCLSIVTGSIVETFYAVYQSQEKFAYESIGHVIRTALLLAGALYAIVRGLSVEYFALLYLLSNMAVLLFCVLLYVRKFPIPKVRLDAGFMRAKMKVAVTFGLVGVFEVIYHWMDSVMLSFMKGDVVVGWYNAAYRLFLVTLFIPSVVSLVVFPVMSRYSLSSFDSLKHIHLKYFRYLSIIGVLIGVSVTLFADTIIGLVFGGEFGPSIVALKILIWSSVLIFINGSFVRLFETTDRQLTVTKVCAGAAILNIFLNFLLIPRFSYIGASAATVFSELLITIFIIMLANRTEYAIKYSAIAGHLVKVAFAGSIFGLCVYYLPESVFLPARVAVSALIYFVILYAIKAINREDVRTFYSLVATSRHGEQPL